MMEGSLKKHNEMLIDKSKIFNSLDLTKRKTKIICTLGKSTMNVDTIVKMIDAGMDVARLISNKYLKSIHRVFKEALRRRPNSGVCLMFTTKGPQINLTNIPSDFEISQDEYLTITSSDKPKNQSQNYLSNINPSTSPNLMSISPLNNHTILKCDYPSLSKSAKEGETLIIFSKGDLELKFSIEKVDKSNDLITIKSLNSGKLCHNSQLILPFAEIDSPSLTAEDERMINSFVLKEGVDNIAVSFVRSAQDIDDIRDALGPRGTHIKIIAKIDNVKGLLNYKDILSSADGVMIARGKLCFELPEEKLFKAQKWMIEKAKLAGKPVITSTQMMESMMYSPRPTLAEVTDVANAVIDGSDSVLLSNETAKGNFPLEALNMMVKICVEAEQCIHYSNNTLLKEGIKRNYNLSKPEAICKAAINVAYDSDAQMIIVVTETGWTVRLLAKYRPKQFILALCMSASVIRQLKITSGVITLKIPSFLGCDSLIRQSIIYAIESGMIKKGDRIVCILGEYEETPDYANTIKVTTA